MPDYTYHVRNGEITELDEFIWTCTPAFGATASAIKISRVETVSFHTRALEKAQAELATVQLMTTKEAGITAQAEYEKLIGSHVRSIQQKRVKRRRYQAMLEKVVAWKLPCKRYKALKNFMCNMLNEAIEYDCDLSCYEKNTPELLSPTSYIEAQKLTAMKDIQRHIKALREEEEFVASRERWIKDLNESIPCPKNLKESRT